MQNFEKLDEGKHQATVVGAQWLWRSQDLGKRGTQGGEPRIPYIQIIQKALEYGSGTETETLPRGKFTEKMFCKK